MSKGITTKDLTSYNQACSSYVAKYHREKFNGSWNLYEKTKVLYHVLTSIGITGSFNAVFSAHTDFLSEDFSSERVISNLYDLASHIYTKFEGSVNADVLGMIVMEASKFVVPFIPNRKDIAWPSNARPLPWMFQKKRPELLARLHLELAGTSFISKMAKNVQMQQKKLDQLQERARLKAEAEKKKRDAQPAHNQARLAEITNTFNTVNAEDIAAKVSDDAELVSAVVKVREGGPQRLKTWLDDVVLMVT